MKIFGRFIIFNLRIAANHKITHYKIIFIMLDFAIVSDENCAQNRMNKEIVRQTRFQEVMQKLKLRTQ